MFLPCICCVCSHTRLHEFCGAGYNNNIRCWSPSSPGCVGTPACGRKPTTPGPVFRCASGGRERDVAMYLCVVEPLIVCVLSVCCVCVYVEMVIAERMVVCMHVHTSTLPVLPECIPLCPGSVCVCAPDFVRASARLTVCVWLCRCGAATRCVPCARSRGKRAHKYCHPAALTR